MNYIQVYTGNGKGKTTAAVGLGLRAAGAGLKVYMAQFIKSMHYSELSFLDGEKIPNFVAKQYGHDCFIDKDPTPIDEQKAKEALIAVTEIIESGAYDVVILDEISIATYFNFFTTEEVLNLLDKKPIGVELILTGRYMPEEIIERADLVTEMKEVRHYYQQGVEARLGFEK